MNKEIDGFVDLLFNFDIKELENETQFLENYKKMQQENNNLQNNYKRVIEAFNRLSTHFREEQDLRVDLQQRIDKAIEYIQEECYINEEDKTKVCSYGDNLNPSYLLEILTGANND